VYAIYPDGSSAQQAVIRLRATGLQEADITVMSGQPMEDFEFGRSHKATWMWWFACGGGLVGMASGLGLAWLTETSWPIDVGGLPIFAWWPNLIVTFELTMLGAILATVVTLVVSARLGRRASFYDPAVSDGKIVVGVANPSDASLTGLEEALGAAGGEVKRLA